jgi:thioester reductase-like protein
VFLSVGGDSLSAVRLSRMIENDLGIPLPLNIFFDPKMTLQRLTNLIQDPSQLSLFSQLIISQLVNDSNLDLDITVDGCKSSTISPSMVFITGTTGFVGAFLLAELLTSYPSQCKFVCLVRCDVSINPLDRIRETMSFYQIWKDDYQQRIIPVRGDLAHIHFGLDDETYQSLVHQIDMIFHCGATVNFVLPYNQLYGPNVCGTREIIHFSTYNSSACIPIQYISTISVLPPGIDKEISIDETSPDRLMGGYAQSKWVAEKLISKASNCGVPIVIYRLGLICADSRSGACNPHDLYTLLFDGMMKMSCYPESAIHKHLNGLPVDFTAKSIVYLSNIGADGYGKIYHVINPIDEIRFEDIIDGMFRCGIEMKSVSNEEWKMKLRTLNEQNSVLGTVTKLFLDNIFEKEDIVSGDQFYNAISGLHWPLFDQDYVLNWLRFIIYHIIYK